MEHSFRINLKGEETGKIFEGDFVYKRPSIRTDSEISKTKAMLDGGMNLDEDTQFIHKVLATLKHTIQNCPKWWEDSDFGFELYDLNVVFDVYKETQKFEKEWRDKVWVEESPEETKKPGQAKEVSKAAKEA